jgi:uncharacterized protein (UPF0332 family)
MSFNWSEYYQIADAFFKVAEQSAFKEAFYRSSISRAYYSAFNIAYKKMAAVWGNTAAQGAEKHQWTIERFNNFQGSPVEKQNTYKVVGANLERLRTYRNNADYDDQLQLDPAKQARITLMLANQILEGLSKHP